MNFRNVLWTYAPKQDGTCDIKLYFSHDGKKKYLSSGFTVKPKDWDAKKGTVKNTHPLASRYNSELAKLRLNVERHFLDGGTWANLLKEKESTALGDYIDKVISEARAGTIALASSTLKNYQSTLTRMRQYEKHVGKVVMMEEVDMAFYTQFSDFLALHGNCRLPGIGKHVKIIKRVMNIGIERNAHSNTAHQRKGFTTHTTVLTDKIYLSEAEIDLLERADLAAHPFLQREIDRWLVTYYFILRFSDVVAIQESNLQMIDGQLYYKYRSEKTNVEAVVPVRKKAMVLLEKYNYKFDWGANQVANRYIKTAAAMAGIQGSVEQAGVNMPKHLLITTHTARRSAATNLYLSGQFSLKTIADLGGWESMKTLQTYLRCSNLDSAMMAAKTGYFQ